MQHPANGVVDPAVVGEGLVSTLVGQDPDTGTKQTLGPDVTGPGCSSEEDVRQELDVVVGEVAESDHGEDVSEDVVEGLEQSSFVAVRRNGR